MRAINNTCIVILFYGCSNGQTNTSNSSPDSAQKTKVDSNQKVQTPTNLLDTARYNRLMENLANGDTTGRWPVKKKRVAATWTVLMMPGWRLFNMAFHILFWT